MNVITGAETGVQKCVCVCGGGGAHIFIRIDVVKRRCGLRTNRLHRRSASIRYNVIVCATIIECVMVSNTDRRVNRE